MRERLARRSGDAEAFVELWVYLLKLAGTKGVPSSTPTDHRGSRSDVNIPKDQILPVLTDRGSADQADRAAGELPDRVGTDRDAGLLGKFGINPQELLGKLGGLGGLGKLL
ncbi:hypothetical protein ABLG96_02480 [Nakamurella sp. A5-74]|uniref:Uncharacterized protein n=1 Tax=Nakamurella sp. A5-74 TaxID=3158264 RepID=A0AAU8DQF6_9ACTN